MPFLFLNTREIEIPSTYVLATDAQFKIQICCTVIEVCFVVFRVLILQHIASNLLTKFDLFNMFTLKRVVALYTIYWGVYQT